MRKKVQFFGRQSLKLCTIGLVVAIGLSLVSCPMNGGGSDRPPDQPGPGGPGADLTGTLAITGTPTYGPSGAILSADTRGLNPSSGNFTFRWSRVTATGEVTIHYGGTYTVTLADVGHVITLTAILAGRGQRTAQTATVELVGTPLALTFVSTAEGYVVSGFHQGASGRVIIPCTHNGRPVVGIADGAFLNNSNIAGVVIPPSVISIGSSAFENTNLTNITLAGTSRLESIGDYAFRGSTSIGSVTIPAGVTEVGRGAFDGWQGNQTIFIHPDADDSGWDTDWDSNSDAEIEDEDITVPPPPPPPPPGALTLSGQVWTINDDNWPQVWQHFNDPNPRFVSSWFGGSGTIVGGQLHFSIDPPHEDMLEPITSIFDYFDMFGGGLASTAQDDGGYSGARRSATRSQGPQASGNCCRPAPARGGRGNRASPLNNGDSHWAPWNNIRFSNTNAGFILLFELNTNDGHGRQGWLSRWHETETSTSWTWSHVAYVYVDRDVTITGTGISYTHTWECSCGYWDNWGWVYDCGCGNCDCGGTERITTSNLNITLRAGWNPLLVTVTESFTGGIWNLNIGVSVNDPADLRWELWEEPEPCRCTANECGNRNCNSCQCEHISSGATAITVTGVPDWYWHTSVQMLLFNSAGTQVARGWTSAHSSRPWFTFVLEDNSWNWFSPAGAYTASFVVDGRHYHSIAPKALTQGNNPRALSAYFEHRAPPLTGTVWINGTVQMGNELWITTSGFPSGATWDRNHQWQRETNNVFVNIPGATSTNYFVQEADIGHRLRVSVSHPNFSGSVESSPTGEVPPPPALTGTVTIGGTVQAGNSIWTNETGFNDGNWWGRSRQWQRGNDTGGFVNIPGATNDSYTLQIDDIGHYIRVVITSSGFLGQLTATTSVPVPPLPYLTGTVSVSGLPRTENTLTRTVSGSNAGTWITQWERAYGTAGGFEPIENATGASYVLGIDDVGYRIRAVVTSTFFAGYIASAPTAVVTARELTIDFDVPIDYIQGPTISLADGPGAFPTITVANPGRFTSITWRMQGTGIGSPSVAVPWSAISGSHDETVALNTAVHGNRRGTHTITVEAVTGAVGGAGSITHSRAITFYVEL